MNTDTLRYAVIMLAAGIGIPILAAMNAQLGQRIGSPPAAAVVLFSVAFAGAIVFAAATGALPALARLGAQPKYLMLAGLFVLFYVLSITFVAPRFGVGNAVFFVLLGQMIAATLIDRYGLFGALPRPISVPRGAGLFLMAAGLALIQRG